MFDDSTRESVERAIVKYSHNDAIQVSAGRYHTPIGWWNAGYHHGRWLQTTINLDPSATAEILPSHLTQWVIGTG